MTFIDFIKQFFKKEQPKLRLLITYSEVYKLFRNCWILIMDNEYRLIPKQEMMNFLMFDNTSYKKYKNEYHDCDDFAVILWGRLKEKFEGGAVGLGVSEEHAFNFFIDDTYQVWIIEPQNDKVFKSTEVKYKFDKILI